MAANGREQAEVDRVGIGYGSGFHPIGDGESLIFQSRGVTWQTWHNSSCWGLCGQWCQKRGCEARRPIRRLCKQAWEKLVWVIRPSIE